MVAAKAKKPVDIRANYKRMRTVKLSPTSINTLIHCPRSWYYKYVEKLPDKPSIHLIKGIAVHHALEKVFDGKITAKVDLEEQLYERAERHYLSRWTISRLGLTPEEAAMHKEDGLLMIRSFIRRLAENVNILIKVGKVRDVYHAFNLLKPKFKEVRLTDPILNVGGSIDQVNTDFDDNITLVDLKTSAKFRNNLPEDYERQLAIYAYLYSSVNKKMPKWVCINYLRYGESFYIRVTDSYIQWAITEIERVRNFILQNNIKTQYYIRESPLCPYCAYRDNCIIDTKKEEESKTFFKQMKEGSNKDGD